MNQNIGRAPAGRGPFQPDTLDPIQRLALLRFGPQMQEPSLNPIEVLAAQRYQFGEPRSPEEERAAAFADIVEDSEEGGIVQAAGQGIISAGRFLRLLEPESFRGRPLEERMRGEQALDLGMLSGLLKGAALDPAKSIAQLVEASMVPALPSLKDSPKVSGWFQRVESGLFTRAEQYALDAGVSESEITAAYELGNFLGLTAPIAASVKIASLFTGTAVGGLKYAWTGDIITDSVAGAIYGGLFVPETELSKRAQNAAKESAMFGVGRIVLQTAALPLRTMRTKRVEEKRLLESVRSTLRDAETQGPLSIRTSDDAISLASLLNEEQWVNSSPAAQRIMTERADELAMIEAIRDVAGSDASGGVFRWASGSFEGAVNLVDRMKRELPRFRFDIVKGQREGTHDIYFGSRGLSNAQRSQLSREGRFDGLDVEYGDAIYEYAGRASRAEYIKVRNKASGKVKEVKEENVTDRFTFAEREERAPEFDALFRDFDRYFEDGAAETLRARGGLTEADWIAAVSRGEISVSPANRRAFDTAGAIISPEELGAERAAAISTAGPAIQGARGQLEPASFFTFDDIFDRWAAQRGIPQEAADFGAMRAGFAARKRKQLWDSVPAEDRRVYESILEEQDRLIETFGIDFSHWAGGKGFSVQSLPEGRVLLREVNSGLPIEFGSEALARDWLKGIVRPEQDLPALIPRIYHGTQAGTNGFNRSYDVWTFDENIGRLETSDLPIAMRGFRPVRDVFIDVERTTGIPYWSQGFEPVDAGRRQMLRKLDPWAKEIADAWKGVGQKRRYAISEVWREVEGAEMSLGDAVRIFRGRGFNAKEISAFTRSRTILDRLFQDTGIDGNRYINLYLSRVVDASGSARGLGSIFDDSRLTPRDAQFFAEYTRTGQLAQLERDPEIILQKYAHALFWRNEVKPAYDRLSKLTGVMGEEGFVRPMSFADVAETWGKEAAASLHRQAKPGTRMSDPILPKELRDIASEYLNSVRGIPDKSWDTLRRFTGRMFKSLGIKGDPRIIEEALGAWQATMYGAALGFRASVVARNLVQNLWLQYTRNGGKHIGAGLESALSQQGFNEAFEEGILRLTEAAIPRGDAIFRRLVSEPLTSSTTMGRIVGGAIQTAVRTGQVGRDLSQRVLKWYGASDQLNRAWAYFNQKLHTGEHLLRYEQGRISWDRFVEEGLPFFKQPMKDRFRAIYDSEGKERALRFIGGQSSDEANFIYGVGGSPNWMQKPWGRFIGMFGQWPMWARELYFSRIKYGTPKQQAAFWARTAALTGIFTNISIQTGTNMWSWIAPTSIATWGGGPATDPLIATHTLLDAPIENKADALKRLGQVSMRLVFPGQVAWNEIGDVLSQTDPSQAFYRLMLGRPVDSAPWLSNWQFDPRVEEQQTAAGYPSQASPAMREGIAESQIEATGDVLRGLLEGPLKPGTSAESRTGVSLDELSRMIRRSGTPISSLGR